MKQKENLLKTAKTGFILFIYYVKINKKPKKKKTSKKKPNCKLEQANCKWKQRDKKNSPPSFSLQITLMH